jgi:two-component system, OmpR family, response regulator
MFDQPPQAPAPGISPSTSGDPPTLTLGAIHVNLRTFAVCAVNTPLSLTRVEFDLLVYLMRNADRVVSYPELVQQAIEGVYRKDSSLIRVHLAHLRRKLGLSAIAITTIRGRGLRFQSTHPAAISQPAPRTPARLADT